MLPLFVKKLLIKKILDHENSIKKRRNHSFGNKKAFVYLHFIPFTFCNSLFSSSKIEIINSYEYFLALIGILYTVYKII